MIMMVLLQKNVYSFLGTTSSSLIRLIRASYGSMGFLLNIDARAVGTCLTKNYQGITSIKYLSFKSVVTNRKACLLIGYSFEHEKCSKIRVFNL